MEWWNDFLLRLLNNINTDGQLRDILKWFCKILNYLDIIWKDCHDKIGCPHKLQNIVLIFLNSGFFKFIKINTEMYRTEWETIFFVWVKKIIGI